MAQKLDEEPASGADSKCSRVAWYAADGVAPVSQEVLRAVEKSTLILKDAGYDVCEDAPPGFSEGQRLWVELFSRAAAEQIRQLYRGRHDDAGPLVSPLLPPNHEPTLEEKVRAAEAVAKAVVERERWREELLRWMRLTPLIIAPVCATPAFEHGASRVDIDGESVSIFRSCSYSQTVNVFGLPAVVVPVARTVRGLPIGVQIIGRPFQESEILAAAAVIEHSSEF